MKVKELYEKRARVHAQMQEVARYAKEEKRELTKEENEKFDKWDSEFNELTRQIKQEETLQRNAAMLADEPNMESETIEKRQTQTYDDVFKKYIRGGANYLTGDEKRILNEKRGTSTLIGSTTTLGGYLIPDQFSGELESTMVKTGGMLQAARIITTSTGGTLDWPTVDDTSTDSNWITQGNAVTVQDFTFAQTTFSDYTVATQVKISEQLLNDEAVMYMSVLAEQLGQRQARALNAAFTTGDGSGKPTGFVTSASTGESAAVSSLTRDNIIDLMHSVDPVYQANGAFMFNDTTLAYIKKLSFGSSDDRPLWVASMRDGAPDTLEGKPYVVNQDMANIGASAKSVAFGDWSKYIIRRVAQGGLKRLDERYADALVVGFILWGRYDGKLLNSSAIKVIAHAAS